MVSLARAGSDAAFGVLFARYEPRLLRFCEAMTAGSAEDPRHVIEQVGGVARREILAGAAPCAVRPWLYRIAREAALQLRDNETAELLAPAQPAAHGGRACERHGRLMADLACLSEPQRAALLLREIDCLAYWEIAEVLQTSVANVETLLVRARITLAEMADTSPT